MEGYRNAMLARRDGRPEEMIKTIDTQGTARKIKQAIEHSGYDIRQISEIFGFSTPQAVYKWTQGKSLPNIDNLLILAHITGKKLDDLIALREEKS